MGRLENIIARNRRPVGFRATVGMVWRGLFILLILGLLLFTDWALTDDAPPAAGGSAAPPAASPPPPRPRDPAERRLDGVPMLRSRGSAR